MADQVLTKQKLINADEDLGDLEEVLSGPPGKIIKTRLGREVYTLSSIPIINTMTRHEINIALSNLSTTANKYYSTLSAANADIANIALNQAVMIGEEANSGLWEKKTAGATTLTKSPYDPALQAKTYVDSNPLFKPVSIDNNPTVSVDLNSATYQNGYFLFTLTPKPQVHLNFPYYGNAAGVRGAGALIAVKEPSGSLARQLYITPDNIYFRATTSGAFENWIKLTSEKDLERFLVKPIAIEQNINANDLKTQGTYQISSTAISNTILNLPEYRSGYLVVSLVNGTNLSQEYVSASNKRYIRHFVSEAWSAWSELVTSVNFRSEFNKNTDLIYSRVGLSFNPKTFAEYVPTNFAIVDGQAKYQVSNPAPGSRSVIVKIDPGKTYTVVKTASSRFRLATFPVLPQEAVLGTVIKGESDGHTNDADLVYFTFTSPIDAQYLVIYVSFSDEAPTSEIYEGIYTGATFNKTIFSRDLEASNIVKSKNIADEREQNWTRYVFRDDGLSGENAAITGWTYPSDGAALIINVKPNTKYTLSRQGGDRFRIALFKRMGNGTGRPTQVDHYRVLNSSIDPQTTEKITFTTNENEFILYAYLTSHVENYGYPDWVQVEEGETATEYESFGYKFSPASSPKNKGSSSGSAAYDYAGVGDANYISKAEATAGAWKDLQYTIPATDDTDDLQRLFSNPKQGVVSLEPNKKYKVTRPIRYNPEHVKLVKGNMAHIVCIGDIETFQMVGTLTGSANAGALNRRLAYNEMGPLVVALKITNPMEVLGTAFVVNKVMSPTFLACNFSYLRRGIVFRGVNRNAILSSGHIFACSDYGIHFEQGGDIHQINIVAMHISYCRKNIFSENHNIYNIQITGGDIETSSYPTLEIGGAAECDMHFLQTTAILEDLEIVGNTIEDHWNTTKMIRLEGNPTTTGQIMAVTISGNVTGNSAGSVIEIGGASGVEISGQFKANQGYVVDVIGDLNGFKLSTQSKQNGGGLFRAVGDYTLKDVTVCGNNLSNSVTQNPILVDVKSLDSCNFSRNDLRVTGTGGFHATHKAPITIHADTMKLVRADNNTIANSVSLTKAVEIVARNSSEKGSMRGNMANSGAFTAPSSFLVEANQ